jgi:Mitochondrial 39-S ribosomal protein L47 (MRP-L47)
MHSNWPEACDRSEKSQLATNCIQNCSSVIHGLVIQGDAQTVALKLRVRTSNDMAVYLQNATKLLRRSTRSLATVVSTSTNGSPALPSTLAPVMDTASAEHDGPLRPHLKLSVNPDHGLYGFFRLKTNENSHSKLREDGKPEYIAVEAPLQVNHAGAFLRLLPACNRLCACNDVLLTLCVCHRFPQGRSWNSSELRRKSFKDLHTLWHILLRERNLLATQKAERKRLTVPPMLSPIYPEQVQKVRGILSPDNR